MIKIDPHERIDLAGKPFFFGISQLLPAVAQAPNRSPCHACGAKLLCLFATVSWHAKNHARWCRYALATGFALDQRSFDIGAVKSDSRITMLLAFQRPRHGRPRRSPYALGGRIGLFAERINGPGGRDDLVAFRRQQQSGQQIAARGGGEFGLIEAFVIRHPGSSMREFPH